MPPRPDRPFVKSLLLAQVFARALGGRQDEIMAVLADCQTGRDGAGLSYFAQALAARPRPLPAADLAAWDAAIGRHEAAIAACRPGFRLTHFQWLACLAVEWHLAGLARAAAAHVAAIEAYRTEALPHLPPYTAADAGKLACFMATGAGKTLVLHVNLLQFLDHGLFAPQNILLLTPNAALSDQHRRELDLSGLGHLPVTVTEITKFFVDEPGVRRPKKGVSEGTSRYEGPNLLLVDEGHKGGSAEAGTERQWRAIREALAQGGTADKTGFAFEYSATFAQIADKDADLYREYAKCTAVDFGYARFYREGYGKEPRVLNARDAEGADQTLAAGLIHFYQQRRAYADHRLLAVEAQVEAPLLACVGKEVTTGRQADVVELVRFLVRAAIDTDWLAKHLAAVAHWTRPAQSELAGDPLDFGYLAGLNLSPDALARDMQERIFGGTGQIEARLLSDKEIGLRCRGAADDAYFGVIRVGEAKKLLALLDQTGVARGEPDRLSGSLFARIDDDARLSILIGAKMFVEGWSSWRVSALALMNVGRSPGAEIIQLFGRGVRLKGRNWSLKREAHPGAAVGLLQTLMVFGVRADYMQKYLETLAVEGARPNLLYVEVAPPAPPLADLGLFTLQPDAAIFRAPVVFDPTRARPIIERIAPLASLSQGLAGAQTLGGRLTRTDNLRGWLADEAAYRLALGLKRRYRWAGLFVAPEALAAYLARCAVEAPADYFDDPAFCAARRAQVAAVCIEKGLVACLRAAEQRWRMARLAPTPLDDDNAGLPWAYEGTTRRLRYRLEVDVENAAVADMIDLAERHVREEIFPPAYLAELQALVLRHAGMSALAGRLEKMLQTALPPGDDLAPPLPRLVFDRHLYQPLLLAQPMVVEASGQLALFGPDDKPPRGLRISPPALNAGEARFAWDLRAFWERHHDTPGWRDISLYLLRNPAAGGVSLFRAAGFAPDFLLWLKRADAQVLAFVDPKGLGRVWPDDKIEMLKALDSLALSLPVRGYLVTPSDRASLALPPGIASDDASLAFEHVYVQENDYIDRLLHAIVAALETPR